MEPLCTLSHSSEAEGLDLNHTIAQAYTAALHAQGVKCIVCGRVFFAADVQLGDIGVCEEAHDEEVWYALPCSEFCQAKIKRRGWLIQLEDND